MTAAGGVPLGFNTIAVSDNQSQATPGMRASLISREVIADSIELMVHAHDFDGLVCLVGCDKTVPAALMALARVDKPAVVLYGGADARRALARSRRDDPGRLEAVGAEERGLMPRGDLDGLERRARVRGRGRAPATSPRTRWPSRWTALASPDRRRADPCGRAGGEGRGGRPGRHARRAARREQDHGTGFLDRRALLNAMAGIAGSGGSTNGILHLLAIAREAGTALSLADLAEVASGTPVLAASRPRVASWPRTSTGSAARPR